ncbi:TetR/AcrR family transcriptional regulator [Virgibacillus doumboii]|uniref:TetR/AcrR family transcriptional regulator n=1 Tax=Virgibacillus doumboii TaxID=2697503 RepID=UPI0013DE7E80|nr:TetR/AcrR family transcriptional regulator [Virgibacillus doumboii]
MNEKKLRLIEAGMKLFAEKGYHSTSIQEIASEAGVSKGAFYLHFLSKEDFITTAFYYYHQQIADHIEKVSTQHQDPRESLAKQIDVVISYLYEFKDFLTMQVRENISAGENTDMILQQMKMQNFRWLRQNITDIYGEKIEPYAVDIVIQLEGIMSGYFKWIVIDDIEIDRTQIGAYLTRRIDDIVNGMLERRETPLIMEKNIPELYKQNQQVTEILLKTKEKISTIELPKEKTEQLNEVTEILLKEVTAEEPKYTMIQGLLVHFQRIPELEKECEQIAQLLHIDLLD